MKFDKETLIVFAVCIALLVAWQPFCVWMGWSAPNPAPTKKTPPAAVTTVSPQPANHLKSTTTPVTTPTIPDLVPDKQALAPAEISNNELRLKIDLNQGVVQNIFLRKFLKDDRKTTLDFTSQLQPAPYAVITGSDWKSLKVTNHSATADQLTQTRMLESATGRLALTQTWKLDKTYQIHYEVKLTNLGAGSITLPALEIMSPSIEPLEFMAGDAPRSDSYGIDYLGTKFASVGGDKGDKDFHAPVEQPIHWLAVQNKYFAAIVKPAKEFAALKTYRTGKNLQGKSFYIIGATGVYRNLTLAPKQTETFDFKCYAGPKELELLSAYDPQTLHILHLSFLAPMEWISRKLLQFLIYLKDVCGGSYGWAIIVLTLIVRLALWPATQKANNSMKKMQKLQPMIKEIREKFKDNQQLMNTKIMELYRAQKVNPLGGCLPILLQIPVFIALYSTIDSAVELRHTSFLWAHDLAQPDTVATIMGIGIHPLVLAMTALMVVQQRLTPAAADPMQQKMMLLMPIVMLFFLYSLPAGLTLYWTVSQIFSIFQMLATRKLSTDDTIKKPA